MKTVSFTTIKDLNPLVLLRNMAKRENNNLNMKEALSAFIQKNKLQGGMDKVDARAAWVRLMGNGVNNYTTAIELKNDILYVSLSSSVLREELSLGISKIISMLNEELGKNLVRKIVLR
ncbi:MAG: hypothetical protein ACI9SG_002067 [Maribacter sp.]|jgi:hypothetical protein